MIFDARLVSVLVLVSACGGDDTSAADATGASSSGADTTGGTGSDGTVDTTGSAEASDTASTSDEGGSEGTSDTTTGGEEGGFAEGHRLMFAQRDDIEAAGVWVDVDVDGVSATAPLLLAGEGVPVKWVPSPSRRWLVVQGISQSWLIDGQTLGIGAPEDALHGLGTYVDAPVFFADDTALAYHAQDVGDVDVIARSLGDDLGDPVAIDTAVGHTTGLVGFGDTLLFYSEQGEVHRVAAQLDAASSEHVADLIDPTPFMQLRPSADGSAVYAYAPTEQAWAIGAIDAVATPLLSPLALPPEPDDVNRVVRMGPARTRLWIFDIDLQWESPAPLQYLALDGTTVSLPEVVPIPAGPDGVFVGIEPQMSADGERLYVAGTTPGPGRAAYVVDTGDPSAPTLTALAGPGIDDVDVLSVLLARDESRLFYTAVGPSTHLHMVALDGGAPIDLTPSLSAATGSPGVSLVEAGDGRAVFFLGRAEPGDAQRVYRVGLVDGVPTDPVAMSDDLGVVVTPRLFAAPDGGAVAYLSDDEVWVALWNDGAPVWYRASDPGMVLDGRGMPTFMPRVR